MRPYVALACASDSPMMPESASRHVSQYVSRLGSEHSGQGVGIPNRARIDESRSRPASTRIPILLPCWLGRWTHCGVQLPFQQGLKFRDRLGAAPAVAGSVGQPQVEHLRSTTLRSRLDVVPTRLLPRNEVPTQVADGGVALVDHVYRDFKVRPETPVRANVLAECSALATSVSPLAYLARLHSCHYLTPFSSFLLQFLAAHVQQLVGWPIA